MKLCLFIDLFSKLLVRSIGELALDKDVFNEFKVWPLVNVVLPAASDQVGETFICLRRNHRSHLLSQFLLDRSEVHPGEWNLTSFDLVQDHAERIVIDRRLIVKALPLVCASKDLTSCPSAQVLVLCKQLSELLERLEVVVSHIDVHVRWVQHDVL